jgi:Transposase DDE domain
LGRDWRSTSEGGGSTSVSVETQRIKKPAIGAATSVAPKYLAPVDPAARWTAANGGLAFFAYATNYLIDLDHAVIVEVEASSAVRQAETTAAKTMITRAHDRFDLQPVRLAADTGYGSAEMLDWLVNKEGIEPESKR